MEEVPTDMVNPWRSWRCNSVTMPYDITIRGTIASYGEQWKEALVLLAKHAPGEWCCRQRWRDSGGFRVFLSNLPSQQWDWRKLQFWRKKHHVSKAAKQHPMLQRTLLWREVSTHIADFTVILFEGTNSLPDWTTTSLITSNFTPPPPKGLWPAESLGASCHF